jgi:hypothetical protein
VDGQYVSRTVELSTAGGTEDGVESTHMISMMLDNGSATGQTTDHFA